MEAVAAPFDVPAFPGWPIVGALPHLQRDIIGTFDRASELGDVVRIDFPGKKGFLVTHPEGVKRVLVDNHRNYGKKTRGYKMLSMALGQGLVTSQGELWRRQRRIAQPSFHHQRISRFVETMDDAGRRMIDRWRVSVPAGGVLEVSEEMMRVTLEIVGLALLSTDLSQESGPIGDAISVVLHETVWRITHPLSLPLSIPTPRHRRLVRALERMHQLVDEVVQERRAGASKEDLLNMFMEARDEETGEGMSNTQLRDEVMTMVSAGHETTANALTWTLHLLAEAPEALARLEEEVDRVLHDDGPLGLERLRDLEWTEAVIKESMRLRP
ncbi:MAG: cytochrome P450, partial [Myxococcota bacterium]